MNNSDKNGKFSLHLGSSAEKFQLKLIGFQTLTIQISATDIEQVINLIPVTESLSEVVIRGTIIPNKLQKIPSSITIITSSDFNRTDATNIL